MSSSVMKGLFSQPVGRVPLVSSMRTRYDAPPIRHFLASFVKRESVNFTGTSASETNDGTKYAIPTAGIIETTKTATSSSYSISTDTAGCGPTGGYNDMLALIAVFAACDHFEHRSTVRSTWGSALTTMPGLKVVFMLGKPGNDTVQERIAQENALHEDIVQGTFVDTYKNLTLKSLMMLRWAASFCPNAKFVLKIDDDVLLNVWDFAATLKRLAAVKLRRTIWGRVWTQSRPSRKTKGRYGKWYVPKSIFPNATYPDYVNGPAYLISGDSVPLLLRSVSVVPYFFIEDVYITGLLADKAGVRRVNDNGFAPERKHDIHPCGRPRVVTSHKWNPQSLRLAWRKMVGRIDRQRCMSLGLKAWLEGIDSL
ncbi:beta-1,3-galactosyltransferase 1 [Dermacentor silvarum]|uniref:beta-1,3-galactosyltransferase 1 n=1 Tax=Dermacentor silvarum TaxID=543639 RepID=UPI00189ACC57|nr:beta-1,3-galactosyltransferase 1 [Dermacentor silvarum]